MWAGCAALLSLTSSWWPSGPPQSVGTALQDRSHQSGGDGPADRGRGCAPDPGRCGYPDAESTGARPGTQLRLVEKDVHTSYAGQSVSALDIRGTLYVDHSDVVVRDVRVTGPGGSSWGIVIGRDGPVDRVVVRDCTVDGGASDQGGVTGTAGSSWTLMNCEVTRSENAVRSLGGALVQSNYLHSFVSTGADPHYDGIEVYSGAGTSVVHNTVLLDRTSTSAVNVVGAFGAVTDTVIERNLIDGGGWQLNVRRVQHPVVGTRVLANRFGPARLWGRAVLEDAAVSHVRGNVDDATGTAVDAALDRRVEDAAPAS